MSLIRIAVDGMGGDHGPSVVVAAAIASLKKNDDLHLTLVGDRSLLQEELAQYADYDATQIGIKHASECVSMDESPTYALRYKKDSSMRVALNLVKEGACQACVSAGNTGALMAISHFVLKNIPGVYRPAIVSTLPAYGKHFRMLDLGGNVDSSAASLVQFAIMGSILTANLDNIVRPKVYLLNIGVELIKGNKQVKETAKLLAKIDSINYQGYIEGGDIYKGEADVIVCDGFVGNIALKTSEGAANFMTNLLKSGFKRTWFTKCAGLIAAPVLKAVLKTADPTVYNGATFLGLQGIVVKSHGHADVLGFARAIDVAKMQVQKNLLHAISEEIASSLQCNILSDV